MTRNNYSKTSSEAPKGQQPQTIAKPELSNLTVEKGTGELKKRKRHTQRA
jgi:hypothetical protein